MNYIQNESGNDAFLTSADEVSKMRKTVEHPMLVVFPIGLWIFSLICDLIGMSVATTSAWFTVALYTMVGGLIGAFAAAVPGLIDLLYYKSGTPPVKKIALTHMTINPMAVALYAVNIWLRTSGQESIGANCPFDHRRMYDRRVGMARWPNGARLWRGGRVARITALCRAKTKLPSASLTRTVNERRKGETNRA